MTSDLPSYSAVARELMGEIWPGAEPGSDVHAYGSATLEPTGEFDVRSFNSFTITYTVGQFGIDDTGAIRVVFRVVSDFGRFQTDRPQEKNYVSATTSGAASLDVSYSLDGQRPWNKAITIAVAGGCLRPGEKITVVLGDTTQGGPGMLLQTNVEHGFEFKVLADVCAVGHFVPLPDQLTISIVPTDPVQWQAVLPTLRRAGEKFVFGIKGEDKWGNPTNRATGKFRLQTSLPVKGLRKAIDYPLGRKSMCFENLQVFEQGILRIKVVDEDDSVIATSPPLLIRDGNKGGYWADLHGQTGETIGINTARSYFDFARNLAFLDVSAHQGNDFQINNRFWAHLNKLTAEYLEEGRFVTFPGYEWSGNTAVGGDRNVFFRHEGRQIIRSHHALIEDRADLKNDANDAGQLFEALKDEDCVVYAHVGGRYADIEFAHDGRIETAVEIHSAWGTFEWLLTDSFKLGHRVGVVCNSDGHKGRPGASFPGASEFGAYGGLTCFLSNELSRDAIFECQRRRHHYGTSGARLHLDVQVDFTTPATLFERDPNLFDNPVEHSVSQAMMGDIVQTRDDKVTLKLDVISHRAIERIEIRNGERVLETIFGYSENDLGSRIRILCCGAEYRGRGRETRWTCDARFSDATITAFKKINIWNHDRRFELVSDKHVSWQTITTGNFSGCDVWLREGEDAAMNIETSHGNLSAALSDIGRDDIIMEAGGLERRLRVFRLPEKNTTCEMSTELEIEISTDGDTPLWVCVTTEDGFQAWSSPIYVFR